MLYLRDIVKRESKLGVPRAKHPSLGRLVVVFAYNTLEAWRDYVVRDLNISEKNLYWTEFFNNKKIKKGLNEIMGTELCPFNDILEIQSYLLGLQALRDFISHGLVDGTARDFDKKLERLKNAKLLINPMELTLEDIENIFKFHTDFGNAIGAVMCFKK